VRSSELFEMLNDTGDAAFVVDPSGSIRFWSRSAERLLGHTASDVVGKSCFDLLAGSDSSGSLTCARDCAALELCWKNPCLTAFDLQVKTAAGGNKWVNVSLIVAPATPGPLLIHLLRDADARRHLEILTKEIAVQVGRLTGREAEQILQPARTHPPSVPLTAREIRVLQLLSQGHSNDAIGSELGVRSTTIRNHIQNILRKLRVHTRVEAVMRAIREGLIQ